MDHHCLLVPSREADLDQFPYKTEYYNNLLMSENARCQSFDYKSRSPQLMYRKSILKDLRLLSDKLSLGAATLHLSVRLLDIFMDNYEIEEKQLILAASSCLLVAGHNNTSTFFCN